MKKVIICSVAVVLVLVLFFLSAFSVFGMKNPVENSVRFSMTDLALKMLNGSPDNSSRHDEAASLFLTYSDKVLFDRSAEVCYRLVKGGIFYRLADVTYTFGVPDGEDAKQLFEKLTEELQAKYRDNENYISETSEDGKETRFGLNFGATSLDITVTRKDGPVKVYVSYLS